MPTGPIIQSVMLDGTVAMSKWCAINTLEPIMVSFNDDHTKFAVFYRDSPTHVISKLVRCILVSHFLRDKGIYHRMSCAMERSPLSASAVTVLPPVQSAMWETIQLLWCVEKV